MKYLRFIIILIVSTLSFSAQFEVIKDITDLPGDITAAKYPYKDVNGQWCAVLKVHTDVKDLQFEGFGYEKHDYRGEGIYLVYLQPETKNLKFKKEGFIPLAHNFPFRLKGNSVYQIDIKAIEEKKLEEVAITVQSEPPGAEIFLNGVSKGRTEQIKTPVGRHELKLVKDGYRTKTTTIEVTAGQTLFKEKLEKTSDAPVEMKTDPAGAAVYLDGIKLGETPFSTFYPEGEYSLRIVKENYQEITEKVRITRSGLKKTATLRDIRALLTVNTYDKAKVYINGVIYDKGSDIRLLPQQCVVRVEMRTAEPVEERFILSAGEIKTLDLFPKMKAGSVQVGVIPSDAAVELIDSYGEVYRSSGSSIFSDVPEGIYSLKITKPGFLTYEQSWIEVRENSKENISITLQEGSDEDFDYAFVEGGTFERQGYKVTVSSFYIGKYEVSQAMYKEVTGTNPADAGNYVPKTVGYDIPAFYVSWYDAVEFCNKLSELEGLAKCYNIDEEKNVTCDFEADGYRLPTEAEWEFAARGGVKSRGYKYSGSDTLSVVGWFEGNSGEEPASIQPQPIGRKRPNELGIFDMSGNVWELCWDSYSDYPMEDVKDPKWPAGQTDRYQSKIKRGGSWNLPAEDSRIEARSDVSGAADSNGITGFRVVSKDPLGKIRNRNYEPPADWTYDETEEFYDQEFASPPIFMFGFIELILMAAVLGIIVFAVKKIFVRKL